MQFWADHGWIITAVVGGFYALLAVVFVLLFRGILRARSAPVLIILGSIAVPIGVALARFGMGLSP